jgi:hypothetical protein
MFDVASIKRQGLTQLRIRCDLFFWLWKEKEEEEKKRKEGRKLYWNESATPTYKKAMVSNEKILIAKGEGEREKSTRQILAQTRWTKVDSCLDQASREKRQRWERYALGLISDHAQEQTDV